METLIESPHLFVLPSEVSVFVLLKQWVFLVFHPDWKGERSSHVYNVLQGEKSRQLLSDYRTPEIRIFLNTGRCFGPVQKPDLFVKFYEMLKN